MSEAQIILFSYSICKDRDKPRTFETYLNFREIDGGMPLTCTLHYFVAGICLDDAEKQILRPVERLASNHICIVNDILSWEKEVQERVESGAVVVNAVEVVMRERGFARVMQRIDCGERLGAMRGSMHLRCGVWNG